MVRLRVLALDMGAEVTCGVDPKASVLLGSETARRAFPEKAPDARTKKLAGAEKSAGLCAAELGNRDLVVNPDRAVFSSRNSLRNLRSATTVLIFGGQHDERMASAFDTPCAHDANEDSRDGARRRPRGGRLRHQ
jgi:hypothetical protein